MGSEHSRSKSEQDKISKTFQLKEPHGSGQVQDEKTKNQERNERKSPDRDLGKWEEERKQLMKNCICIEF